QSPQLSEQLRWFESVSQRSDCEYWMIELDNNSVGVVNLIKKEPNHKRSDWAFYLGSPEIRGRGVGSKVESGIIFYVFSVLMYDMLHCQVFSTNEAVIGLHRKFGFEVEGILKKHFFRAGEWQDLYLLSLFRGEVEKRGYLSQPVEVIA